MNQEVLDQNTIRNRPIQRRLALHFEDLRDTVTDVQMLHENGWDRAGNWSLGQVLDHLNITLRFTFGDIPFFVPMPVRAIAKLVFWPTVKKGKPIKFRGIAPRKIQPRVDPNEAEMVDEYIKLVDKHYNSNLQFAPVHPAVGKLDRDEWLLIQKWHATHHLSFMVPKERNANGPL